MSLDNHLVSRGDTTASQVERHLREQIIQLDLAPGTRLSEQEIATRLGTSRQPVREALIALAKSQLVEIRPNRGTVVVKISARQMIEARFVREAIEVAVVRRAAEVFDRWSRERLEAIIDRQRRACEAADHNAFRREDELFHIMIAEGARCRLAWSAVADIKAHMDRVCNLQLHNPASMRLLIDQHCGILAAIDSRDADAASEAMRVHLSGILSDLPRLEAEHPALFERD